MSYPSRGTEVSRLERTDIEQIFGIRLALEKAALERAVLRMGEKDHRVLHELLLRMDAPPRSEGLAFPQRSLSRPHQRSVGLAAPRRPNRDASAAT